MLQPAESWSTQQLAEFAALVASFPDRESAVLGAIERAAEALETEVAALVGSGGIESCLGFPAGEAPARDLARVAAGDAKRIEVPGLGGCAAASVSVGAQGKLVVARYGEGRFSQEESDLLRGMGRVLALTLRNLELLDDERRLRERSQGQVAENARLLASLRERQTLLERLSKLQRSIVRRADLREVLDAIVAGAKELLGEEVVALRLVDSDDPSHTIMVSATGLGQAVLDRVRRMPVGVGSSGLAIAEERLVVMEDYPTDPGAIRDYAEEHIEASMAAPVFEGGDVAGALVVSSRKPGRRFSRDEQEVLTAFAEHASLALNDARAVEEAVHQAFHDSLTDLPNRALFLDRLERAARHRRATVGVLFADLDGFKTVNDSLGHAAGDELLVAVAHRLSRCVRPSDTAARFGGDEFAILLEQIHGPADAIQAARRILDALEAPFRIRDREVYVDASIGIATGRGEPDHLMRNADLAMYKAKSRGKGRYDLFEPGMHSEMVERMELEGDLKRAVERSEFVLHYQPILDLRTGQVIAAEALVRWNHPRRGLTMPDDFLPIAEETGQIRALGRWVLVEACRQAALWRARYPGHSEFAMAVNISGIQLQQAKLVDEVRAALETSGLDASHLILEITETVLMDDTETNISRLGDLKALGVRIAVDDFGTGYSSLQYLQRFPIDMLKIAKSFVDGLGSAAEEPAVARAIIDLGESLDLAVVAEGIELDEQAPRLLELGCELGQGFLFAHPLEAGGMDSLLLERGLLASRRNPAQAPAPPAPGSSPAPPIPPVTDAG